MKLLGSEDWGRSLGTLHTLSKLYKPEQVRRKSWQDILHDIENVMRKHSQEHEAMEELKRLTRWLEVIDFDDAMYHWYAMDIVTTLDDLYDNHDGRRRILKSFA